MGGVSYANEAAMVLLRDAPWDVLQGERFLSRSRAEEREIEWVSKPKSGTEALI